MTALKLRPTVIGGERLENDFVVIREERQIGRLREATERIGFNPGWTWGITVPLPIPPWGSGLAESKEAAQAAFKDAWARFYETLTPDDIAHWHHHQDAAAQRFR